MLNEDKYLVVLIIINTVVTIEKQKFKSSKTRFLIKLTNMPLKQRQKNLLSRLFLFYFSVVLNVNHKFLETFYIIFFEISLILFF